MKNKEWVEKVLAHETDLPVPFNFSFSPPALNKVENHYGGSPIQEALDFPIRMKSMKSIKPTYASPAEFGPFATDEFGVKWTTNDIDRGSPDGSCLDGPDLSGYTFPDPSVEYRFEDLGQWCSKNRDNYTLIWIGDLWERATFMRGMEHILLDLVLNSKFVHNLLRGITDHILTSMDILFSRFEFDGVALSDDYGAQNGLIMSPDMWREFIQPCLSEIYTRAKTHGRTVFHHTCGDVTMIIPDMIELGLDILHPIQPEAMDPIALKREYGNSVTLCGGVSTQKLLPYGTPDEVRAEVKRLKRLMGADGGYILEPGITLQADIPVENLVALIDEARNT
ncbi:MAG: uroporphyrinogen decarboxylase family protein [Bacteroidota bacterium]